jgi:hypothetical protein
MVVYWRTEIERVVHHRRSWQFLEKPLEYRMRATILMKVFKN